MKKSPHPDHDHEYTVPDMVPALSRSRRGENLARSLAEDGSGAMEFSSACGP